MAESIFDAELKQLKENVEQTFRQEAWLEARNRALALARIKLPDDFHRLDDPAFDGNARFREELRADLKRLLARQ